MRQMPSPLQRAAPALRVIAGALLLALTTASQAQLARKPSYYEEAQGASASARQPAQSAEAARQKGGVAQLSALRSREAFDELARVYGAGTPLAQPHVIFVIDLARPDAPAISFVNTPRFQLHERFLRETGRFRGGREAFNRNYAAPDRRFLLGTLSWQPQIQGFVFEFWEGDVLTPALLQTARDVLGARFYAPLQFKANSTAQEQVARGMGLVSIVTPMQLIGQQGFLPLNTGQAVGQLRIVQDLEHITNLQPQDIVVLREVPISLPPVAGVVTERPSTMISHVNLLAKGWGIPNAFVQGAQRELASHDGQWVHLTVNERDWTLRAASPAEREAARQRADARTDIRIPTITADLHYLRTQPLSALSVASRAQCGAKAAHLGEIKKARITGVIVPDGYCIPFGVYARAMKNLGLTQRVRDMQALPGFANDAQVRREALARLRSEIEQMPLDPALTQEWARTWTRQLGSRGVFVRSSSSSEDLPQFSGAGLYSTVPNVQSADALAAAVLKVWASVFHFEAWEARRAAGIPHDAVHMAVLVQLAVNSQASGVMVTRSPLAAVSETVFIAAKRGLGIRVVDGQRVAEQVLYSRRSRAAQVISQSEEASSLQLDPQGGVREVPLATTEHRVLDDARIRRLAEVGAAIEKRFGGRAQDIEWALTDDEHVIVLQARPYAVKATHQ